MHNKPMQEFDIVYETGKFWVYRDRKNGRYTVFVQGFVGSVSDSSCPLTPDGLSVAKARADYLAKKMRAGE